MQVNEKSKYKEGDVFLRRYKAVAGIQTGTMVLGEIFRVAPQPDNRIIIYYRAIEVVGDIELQQAVTYPDDYFFIVGTGFEAQIITDPVNIIKEVFG